MPAAGFRQRLAGGSQLARCEVTLGQSDSTVGLTQKPTSYRGTRPERLRTEADRRARTHAVPAPLYGAAVAEDVWTWHMDTNWDV
jgi:hypothetical protein